MLNSQCTRKLGADLSASHYYSDIVVDVRRSKLELDG